MPIDEKTKCINERKGMQFLNLPGSIKSYILKVDKEAKYADTQAVITALNCKISMGIRYGLSGFSAIKYQALYDLIELN